MIAIAKIFRPSRTDGSISLCSLKSGCTANLTNPNMHEVAGVAMSKDGDCWASAIDANSHANLTYFKGCSGSGATAKGFINPSYGGLDFDAAGNLVSFSGNSAQLYVYRGCNPRCKLVGGPFSMGGTSVYGHLNKSRDMLAVADYQHGQIDLYTYTPTAVQLRTKLQHRAFSQSRCRRRDLRSPVGTLPRCHFVLCFNGSPGLFGPLCGPRAPGFAPERRDSKTASRTRSTPRSRCVRRGDLLERDRPARRFAA